MDTLTTKIVFTNGSIDQDATLEAAATQLSALAAERTVELDTVRDAVLEQFSKSASGFVTIPVASAMAANSLNAQLENVAYLTELCADYIRANSKGPDSMFVIVRVRGKGVCTRATYAASLAAK